MLHRHKRVNSADVRQVDVFFGSSATFSSSVTFFATLVASSSTLYTCDSVARKGFETGLRELVWLHIYFIIYNSSMFALPFSYMSFL